MKDTKGNAVKDEVYTREDLVKALVSASMVPEDMIRNAKIISQFFGPNGKYPPDEDQKLYEKAKEEEENK